MESRGSPWPWTGLLIALGGTDQLAQCLAVHLSAPHKDGAQRAKERP